MPIVYFTQLMGYGFGLSPEELLFDSHLTEVDSIFKRVR
jgi:heterodisulfide reductase subunit B